MMIPCLGGISSDIVLTSGTAQGGGSFKDRKPIGEDGRANPLMDKSAWSCAFFAVVALVTSPTTAECSVV